MGTAPVLRLHSSPFHCFPLLRFSLLSHRRPKPHAHRHIAKHQEKREDNQVVLSGRRFLCPSRFCDTSSFRSGSIFPPVPSASSRRRSRLGCCWRYSAKESPDDWLAMTISFSDSQSSRLFVSTPSQGNCPGVFLQAPLTREGNGHERQLIGLGAERRTCRMPSSSLSNDSARKMVRSPRSCTLKR